MIREQVRPFQLFGLSFFRNPLNVALLIVIPPMVIHSYGVAMEAIPDIIVGGRVAADVGRVNGALFATAFLTGLFGLFQIIGAYNADRRLVTAGFSRVRLLVVRVGTILVVSSFVGLVSYAVFSWYVSPERPLVVLGTLVVAGVSYGLLGVLIGSIVPRKLEGSLALVFIADADTVFGSGLIEWDSLVPKLYPLYYPNQLLGDAAFEGTIDTTHAALAGGYAVGLLAVVTVVFAFVMRGGAIYE